MRITASFPNEKCQLVKVNDGISHLHLFYLLHLALTRSLHNFLNLTKPFLLVSAERNALRDLICTNTKRILSPDQEV